MGVTVFGRFTRLTQKLKNIKIFFNSGSFGRFVGFRVGVVTFGKYLSLETVCLIVRQFTLPRIDDVLDQLGKTKYFLCLD